MLSLMLIAFLQLLNISRMHFCISLLAGDIPITVRLYLKIHGEQIDESSYNVKDRETITTGQFVSQLITARDRLVCRVDVLVRCLAVTCEMDLLP